MWVFRAGGTNSTVLVVKQKAMKEYPQYLHVQLDCFDIQTDKTTKEQLLLSGHGWNTTSLYVACYLQNLQWDCVSEWVSMVSWETQFCCQRVKQMSGKSFVAASAPYQTLHLKRYLLSNTQTTTVLLEKAENWFQFLSHRHTHTDTHGEGRWDHLKWDKEKSL